MPVQFDLPAQFDLWNEAATSPELSVDEVLATLEQWHEWGWLRALDLHFARFLQELGEGRAEVLMLAALTSHQAGRGHICLVLSELVARPFETLKLPPEPMGQQGAPALLKTLSGYGLDCLERALASASVVDAVHPESGSAPLVFEHGLLYLRRFWASERRIAHHINVRMSIDTPGAPSSEALAHLFGASPSDETDWQQVACALALRQRFAVISGGPGTGKTTTVAKLLVLLQQQALAQGGEALSIQMAAPTGKAAARLTESMAGALTKLSVPETVRAHLPREAMTLHRLLGARPDTRRFRFNETHVLETDVLLVDEASMVDLELMAALMNALKPQARLILLGDRDQLASVEAGAILGDICASAWPPAFSESMCRYLEHTTGADLTVTHHEGGIADHVVVLQKSYRFSDHSGIGHLARAINQGDIAQARAVVSKGFNDIALTQIEAGERTHVYLAVEGYRAYLEAIEANASPAEVLAAFQKYRMLCALRQGDWGVETLNERIAEALQARGWIDQSSGWYVGRPVLITRNDRQLGLYNGDIGIALPDPAAEGRLRVFVDQGERIRSVLPARLTHADTAYAMTVHKSQGSEFETVTVVMPPSDSAIMTRELLYTALTRARSMCTLCIADTEVFFNALTRRVQRSSGLSQRLGELTDQR
ncbi:exodeoxyribonuclease V subunit alpha [Larsenimonas salina]|uniref:exodeoxyribonuclease V subunit alpha n=1 Tax=Larsenimonas salina TaxID=1295565 RepID=UPI0020747439|nr:exodeoxyribonuclease V subunit alpha [Larsenimonas salina]MCM5703812.1 exodeoxyribonuclease V subunit alpha [Larsenimonas salina]